MANTKRKNKVRFEFSKEEESKINDTLERLNDDANSLLILNASLTFSAAIVQWITVLSLASQFNLSDLLHVSIYSFVSTLGSFLVPASVPSWFGHWGCLIIHRLSLILTLALLLFNPQLPLIHVILFLSASSILQRVSSTFLLSELYEAQSAAFHEPSHGIETLAKFIVPLIASGLLRETSLRICILSSLFVVCIGFLVDVLMVWRCQKSWKNGRDKAGGSGIERGTIEEGSPINQDPETSIMEQANTISMKLSNPTTSLSFLFQQISNHWNVYINHEAFMPSFAWSLLYFSTMSTSPVMMIFLSSQLKLDGMSLALVRSTSIFFGALSSVTTEPLIDGVGLLNAGMLSVWFQVVFMLLAEAPLDSTVLFASTSSTWIPEDIRAVGVFVFLSSLVVSRWGVWSLDLIESQLVHEICAKSNHGVGGQPGREAIQVPELWLQTLFELCSYIMTMVFSRKEMFWIPTIVSVVVAFFSALTFTFFALSKKVMH